MYTYDLFGWYAAAQYPSRAATHAPDNTSLTTIQGALRANWTGSAWVDLPYVSMAAPTKKETIDQLKAERKLQVDAIKVTTSSGKTFDGDEDAQSRMARAILAADITGQADAEWVLADNTVATVTQAELKEALGLAMQAMGAIWASPYKEAA